MKQIIMIAFVMIFLSVFFAETINFNLSADDRDMFYEEIDKLSRKAKLNGYVSNDMINEFKTDVSNKSSKVSFTDVQVVTDGVPKYKMDTFDESEYIEFTVTITHQDAIKYNEFWGIPENETVSNFTDTRVIASEVLAP